MEHKFKIGDCIQTTAEHGHTQKYIIVDISYKYRQYVCVDAWGREGIRAIQFQKDIPWGASEEEFELADIEKHPPFIYDPYIEEFNLPKEWSWSNYKKMHNIE